MVVINTSVMVLPIVTEPSVHPSSAHPILPLKIDPHKTLVDSELKSDFYRILAQETNTLEERYYTLVGNQGIHGDQAPSTSMHQGFHRIAYVLEEFYR